MLCDGGFYIEFGLTIPDDLQLSLQLKNKC